MVVYLPCALQQNTSPRPWPIPAWELLLWHGWSTGLRCSKFSSMYQNKRSRVGGWWEAGEGFEWKHESGHYDMYGIIIVYIAYPLPTNHIKSPAQCWLWRGHEQQDSNSVTLAESSVRGTGPGRISQPPWDMMVPAAKNLWCALRHDPTCSCHMWYQEKVFSLFLAKIIIKF